MEISTNYDSLMWTINYSIDLVYQLIQIFLFGMLGKVDCALNGVISISTL